MISFSDVAFSEKEHWPLTKFLLLTRVEVGCTHENTSINNLRRNTMDLPKLASQLLGDKLKLDLNNDGVPDTLSEALNGLMGKANAMGEEAGIDLAGLVDKMKSSGNDLQEMASSWLGDGENKPISFEQVKDLFSSEKISEFANKLGVSADEATSALSEALPQIVDKSSRAGELFDSLKDQIGDNATSLLDKIKNQFK